MQQKRKVELLAPAGNMEKLKTAFHFGADACFVGGSAFNLRGMSSNFKNSELKKAIDYVHSLGKRIFVTLNIFAHNSEIEYMPRFIRLLDEYGADAVIVADLGVFQLVREHAPNLPIHVSTQANNTNWMSVKTWRDMGAKRVILAREMSLNEIRTIKEKVPDVEVEVFIHGAMCMAISGRCLLSNYFTSRDANRGICAQDCRWSYKVIAEGHEEKGAHDIVEEHGSTFIFNAKDLCTIEFIDKVLETGVDSLKIEGRMKSIYYNSTVRNRVYASSELELVRPHQDPVKFKIKNFLNTKNNEIIEVAHPNTVAIIETDVEMEPMDLIRVRLPEGQSDTDMETGENTL